MAAPFEIVCAPYDVYVAPALTAFPNVDTPASAFASATSFASGWKLSGTSGAKNYDDTGVAVGQPQTVNTFTPAGSTTPRKVWRTGEELTVTYTLADVSPEQYALTINNATVTTVAAASATAGTKSFELMRGVGVATHAVLVRGISSVDDSLIAQYEIKAAYQGGSPTVTYSKQNPAELA